MKTLEKILGIACGSLIGLGSLGISKAVHLDYVAQDSIKIITKSDNEIGKSTICENYIAWEQGGNVYVQNRTTEDQTLVNSSSQNPNLDSISGNKLVYDKEGSIYRYDLETLTNRVVYQSTGTEITSNPKINGDNLVFRLYFEIEDAEVGQIIGYDLNEEMFYPITNSLNKKTQPDIFGRYVTWTEEEDHIVYSGQKKFSNKIYDLQLAQEMTLAENFVTANLDSSAVYGSMVASVASSILWDNGPSSLVLHDLSYYENDENPRGECIGTGVVHSSGGKKDNAALYGNLFVWEDVVNGYIKGVDLTSRVSVDQFTIAGPHCHNPDVYVDSNGDYNVIYMTEYGPVVDQPILSASGTFGTSNSMEDHASNYLVSAKIIPYNGPFKCGERGTKYLSGDINQDCYIDFGDLEIIADNWLKEGLGQERPIDGNESNTAPSNLHYECELGPEIIINNQIRSLDLNGDCKVNLYEYSQVAKDWPGCTDPANENCGEYYNPK